MSDPAKAYAEKAEAELLGLEAQIKQAKADAKIKNLDLQNELDERLTDARQRLTRIKDAGAQAGGDLKQRMGDAMADLRRAWERATS